MAPPRSYLALGDGLFLDPAGAEGGGAARQVHMCLSEWGWQLDERCAAWSRMAQVPTDASGTLVTLSVGSADITEREVTWAAHGLDGFRAEHAALLGALRSMSPSALLLVTNIPTPRTALDDDVRALIGAANDIIRETSAVVDGIVVDVASALGGREQLLLTDDDTPTLAGASVVATLVLAEVRRAGLIGP